MAVELRPGRPDEKQDLEALQMRASLMWDAYRQALEASPDAVELPLAQLERGDVIVAIEAGRPVGFAAIADGPDGPPELDGLFVEPSAWGRGHGRMLVEAIAAMALQRGARTLAVVANPRAEGFYRRCGFQTIGRADTRFGPAIRMERAC